MRFPTVLSTCHPYATINLFPHTLHHTQAASPVPFGLFGAKAAPQQVEEEEEEEEGQVAAAPALPFAGFFGAKQAPVQVCWA